MPTYAYSCDACGCQHEEFRSISQPHPTQCPDCSEPFGDVFRQEFMGSNPIGIVRNQPTTFGQQAEINARRMGKEQMQIMAEQSKKRVSQFTGKLPDNASINTTGTGERPWWRDGVAGLPTLDKPLDMKKVKDSTKYIETGEMS